MKNRLFKYFIITFVATLLLTVSTSFAMYIKDKNSDKISFEINNATPSTISVSNYKEFAFASSYERYNSNVIISDPTLRKTIKLSDDIALHGDVIISADVSIDLNGKTLDLNGYNLYVRHNFHGISYIENGTIINSKDDGSFIVQTPYSVYNVANVVDNDLIILDSFNDTAMSNVIFNKVEKILLKGPANNNHHKDVVLIDNYYNSDILFTYTSSNLNIFDSKGHINTSGISGSQAITVTLTLNINEVDYTKTYDINIVPISNQTRWLEIARDLVVEYLEPYYNNEESTYQIAKDLMLIPKNEYIGIDYEYKMLRNNVEDPNLINNFVISTTIFEEGLELEVIPKFSPSIYLSPSTKLPFDFVVPMTRYDWATYIVEETFGSFIQFTDVYVSHDLIDLSNFIDIGISEIVYSTSMDGFYEISPVLNTITSIADASNLNIYLNIVFKFDDGATILRRVRLVFNADTVDPFDPYYYEIRLLFQNRTNGYYTYESFYLPDQLTLDNTTYLLDYIVTSSNPSLPGGGSQNVVSVIHEPSNNRYQININKNTIPVDNTDIGISIKYLLEEEVGQNPYTTFATELIFMLPGVVRNNAAGIPNTNLYNAVEALFNNDNDRNNGLLLKDSLNQNLDLDVSSKSITNFKGIEYLTNLRSLIAPNNSFGNATYYKNNLLYVGTLKHLVELNLENNGITTAFQDQIALNSLRKLNLSRNQISFTKFIEAPNLEELNLSYNRLSSIIALPMFNNLKILNISNNSITHFYPLENYRQLDSLYIFNNGTYNSGSNTYGTNFSTTLYNKEALIYLNYQFNINIYNDSNGTLTVYNATEKSQSKVLRGIIYITEGANIPTQLPTTVTSYGGFNHTLSYGAVATSPVRHFVANYRSGSTTTLSRFLLLDV